MNLNPHLNPKSHGWNPIMHRSQSWDGQGCSSSNWTLDIRGAQLCLFWNPALEHFDPVSLVTSSLSGSVGKGWLHQGESLQLLLEDLVILASSYASTLNGASWCYEIHNLSHPWPRTAARVESPMGLGSQWCEGHPLSNKRCSRSVPGWDLCANDSTRSFWAGTGRSKFRSHLE